MSTTTSGSLDTNVVSKPQSITFTIEEQCPIQYVTVYNDRAEVTRSLKHHFDAEGVYDLVLRGFSPSVDLTSLHISGGTGKACTILEVTYQTRHEENPAAAPLTSLEQLQNDLEQVENELGQHQRELARLGKQRAWLDGRATKLMNQDGQVKSEDLESMQQFLDFYYRTSSKLDEDTTREETAIKQLNQRKETLKGKINEHGAAGQEKRNKTVREVTIGVHIAAKNIDISLEVAYLISHCSWSASYDVRVNNSDSAQQKTQLTYYGIIVNKSQENWSDVQLSLSTATPSLGGSPPKLNTLRVNYYTPVIPSYARYTNRPHGEAESSLCAFGLLADESDMRMSKKSRSLTFQARKTLDKNQDDSDSDRESSNMVNVLGTKTEASMSSTSFAIPRRSTIEADGKPHKVTIGVLDLTSTFIYTVVPKLSVHAFLKAKTTNTSDKQLLAGPASVFMDNNFVTHSSIENVCLGDTFDVPLGTDASIKVEYKPVRKTADTQGLISKVKYENIRHETRLTNTKSTEVTVFVYEQVPMSSTEKIKVKLNIPDLRAKDHASLYMVTMNDSNIVEWKCVIPAKGECRLPLEYTIEWPKDKQIECKEDS